MKNKKHTMILNYQVGEPAPKDDNPQRIFKIMEPSLHEVWAKFLPINPPSRCLL